MPSAQRPSGRSSPSSLAFDAACWAAVVAAIQLSNHLADNPPALPELRLPGGHESYPLTVAEPQIYAQPVGSDQEIGLTIPGTSADSTLQIGNVLADPLPGVDPTGHIYASTQQQGWKVGDPITNLTSKGTSPSWSAVRSRYWKNEAYYHPERWDKSNLERMQRGLAPQRINPLTGKLESMELHHNPAQREGGLFEVEPLWPGEHASVDPYRKVSQ